MASRHQSEDAQSWAVEWLSQVAEGANTMSQRQLTSVEKHGGLDNAKAVAEKLGVHLLQIEDDKGNEVIAASTRPFKVIC